MEVVDHEPMTPVVLAEIRTSFRGLSRMSPAEVFKFLEVIGIPSKPARDAVDAFMEHTRGTLLPAEFVQFLFPNEAVLFDAERLRPDAVLQDLQKCKHDVAFAEAEVARLREELSRRDALVADLQLRLSAVEAQLPLEDCLKSIPERCVKAAEAGDVSTVRVLLEKGADPNFADAGGWVALHHAAMDRAQTGSRETAALLLQARADASARGALDRTPLHLAAYWDRRAVTELLLENGADANACDSGGTAPLHSAAQRGRREIAELLLAHGADARMRDELGKTPAEWAETFGKRALAARLRDAATAPLP